MGKSPITRWLTWEAIALLTIFVIVVLTEGLSLRAQEASVNPGINNNFLNPDLEAESWVQRFEIESREVFSARHDVAGVMAIQPGDKIADVGAGTGFYAKLFSETTGEDGWVYAVDIVFTCDTYHHFEYPAATLASIRRALKPGGSFVVVDFERVPGKTRQWLLDHVRCGKEQVIREVSEAGFTLEAEVPLGFTENYFLRFRR